MPLPATKSELLARLRAAHAALDAEFDGLEDSLLRRRDLEGGISASDVLAYQIGWARLLLAWEAAEQRGVSPEMPAPGFRWNELGRLAASFHAEFRGVPVARLRETLRRRVEEIAGWIDSLEDREIFAPGERAWAGEKWPVVKWIQVNTVAPHGSGRAKIRKWKKGLDRGR